MYKGLPWDWVKWDVTLVACIGAQGRARDTQGHMSSQIPTRPGHVTYTLYRWGPTQIHSTAAPWPGISLSPYSFPFIPTPYIHLHLPTVHPDKLNIQGLPTALNSSHLHASAHTLLSSWNSLSFDLKPSLPACSSSPSHLGREAISSRNLFFGLSQHSVHPFTTLLP